MSDLNDFAKLLEEIDQMLDSLDPGELHPDTTPRKIFTKRAEQRPILETVVELCTRGLKQYPYNSLLLRRRAQARFWIVNPEGEHPELEGAEQDLKALLELDPHNLYAVFDLLEAMFSHSGLEDKKVAELAEDFAQRAERVLLAFRALQITALGYANEREEAETIYNEWIGLFPDSERLKQAKEDADSMKPEDR